MLIELRRVDSGLNYTYFTATDCYAVIVLSKAFFGGDSQLVTQSKAEHGSYGKGSLPCVARLHIARDPRAQGGSN